MTQAKLELDSLVKQLRVLLARRADIGADLEQVLLEIAATVVAIADVPAQDLDCCVLKARALGDLVPFASKLTVARVLAQSLLADLSSPRLNQPDHSTR